MLSERIIRGIRWRLTSLGEKTGIHWLIYNPLVFREFHWHATMNAPGVIDVLTAGFPDAARWADVGCGSGAFSAELKRRGKQVVACEHGRAGRRLARKQGVDCREFDLALPVPADLGSEPFDIAYSFEVAEHLPPFLGERLVKFLCSVSPTIVFTGAHVGQGGIGHINEQPASYWIDLFAKEGFQHDAKASEMLCEKLAAKNLPGWWFAKNVIVLTSQNKKPTPLSQS